MSLFPAWWNWTRKMLCLYFQVILLSLLWLQYQISVILFSIKTEKSFWFWKRLKYKIEINICFLYAYMHEKQYQWDNSCLKRLNFNRYFFVRFVKRVLEQSCEASMQNLRSFLNLFHGFCRDGRVTRSISVVMNLSKTAQQHRWRSLFSKMTLKDVCFDNENHICTCALFSELKLNYLTLSWVMVSCLPIPTHLSCFHERKLLCEGSVLDNM